MGNCTFFYMFENPRRGRQARNFPTNVPKILDLKSSSEQLFFRKLSLGAPGMTSLPRIADNLALSGSKIDISLKKSNQGNQTVDL